MKARIINTPVEVEVEPLEPIVDWGAFRRETAKNLLVAMTRKAIDDSAPLDAFEPDFYARIAVEWADSLIKHLIKKEEDEK